MDYDPSSLTLEPVSDMKYALPLEADWDWHLGNKPTLAGYLHSKLSKPDNYYFWILYNAHPVGIVGLNIHPDHKQWQTIIYLNKTSRGKGVNTFIHKTLSEAFTHTGVTLIASIDVKNTASINSFSKMLNSQGSIVLEQTLKREACIYILTEETFTTNANTNQDIIEIIVELGLK